MTPMTFVCNVITKNLSGMQIHETNHKSNKWIGLMILLAGAKWEYKQDTLNMTYRMYVKPFMTYENEVVITASNSGLDLLERL